MNEFMVTDIPQGYFFSQPAYLDDGFILLPQETPYTNDLGKLLNEWQFTKIFSNGAPQDHYAGKTFEKKSTVYAPNDAAKITDAQNYIAGLKEFTYRLFKRVESNYTLHFDTVASTIRELYEKIRDEKRYLLRIENMLSAEEYANPAYFNAVHCIKSAIISIIIGIHLKLPVHRLIELGVAALTHEVGMTRLPAKLYLTGNKMTAKELQKMQLHTMFGYDVLKSSAFPMSISVVALEHHERENGEGYPKKVFGGNISLYSKIVAVACSYTAITTKRPHQDAQTGYEGITNLLQNERKQYDDTILRALVYSLSLYPIGQWIMLSDGRKGQVIDVNPADPRFPVVQLFSEQTPDGKNKIIETSQNGIHIAQPLSNEDDVETAGKNGQTARENGEAAGENGETAGENGEAAGENGEAAGENGEAARENGETAFENDPGVPEEIPEDND